MSSAYTQQFSSRTNTSTSGFAQTIPSKVPKSTLPKAGAQTISPSPTSAVHERLANLSNQFSKFHLELDAVRQEKQQQEQRRYNTLQSQVSLLREALTTESSNRAQSLRSLQGWVEERVSQWREDVEAPIHLRITAVEGQLAKLNQSVAAVTLEQTRTRDYMPVLVEDLGSALRERIDECVSMVSVERQAREEREERAAAKLQEVGRRLREQMLGEREATLARLDELKQSVSAEVESRESAVSRVEKLIEETKAALEAAMEHEERERTVGEQTLAHVLADNTAALLTNAQIMARH